MLWKYCFHIIIFNNWIIIDNWILKTINYNNWNHDFFPWLLPNKFELPTVNIKIKFTIPVRFKLNLLII